MGVVTSNGDISISLTWHSYVRKNKGENVNVQRDVCSTCLAILTVSRECWREDHEAMEVGVVV